MSLNGVFTGVGWNNDGEPYVRLFCMTFVGQGQHQLTPDEAEQLAGLLMTMATLARESEKEFSRSINPTPENEK